MSEYVPLILFVILAIIVGGGIWAYGHVKSIHDKIDLLLHRNTAVDAQMPTATPPTVVVNVPPPVVSSAPPSPAPAPVAA